MTRDMSKARDMVTRYGLEKAADVAQKERINAQVRAAWEEARYWHRVLASIRRDGKQFLT